ncbi:polypeptide N-acetylgalactosaminyltransferase 15-like [Scleropages formosus]|uniref:polypeptide N-acetylgalactosaminyltransferase 15-like n=1 Tax=Scleropages formosus TaxID=113540 RepID=UPI0010FA905D|nr:polypeptide N-acetylgalactosaminyltransferase 15 [Scleropages formosus]
MMTLRCRHRPHRSPLLCFWLVLLLVVIAVLFMDPLFRDASRHAAIARHAPTAGHRWPAPADLELLVDSRDQGGEGGFRAPAFLRDDQLLVAPSSAPAERRGSGVAARDGRRRGEVEPRAGLSSLAGKAAGRATTSGEAAARRRAFDEAISEGISFHRRPPESRPAACLSQQYNTSLPTATVVVCFHDEAWSTLLRTIHSVLDTAPARHLREVLLVDDCSERGHLKTPLSKYVSKLKGVRLIRSARRLGVVGCRVLGAARALGDVLVFLDSHCECQQGWLEPLLERIAGDRSRVVSPVMDVIDGRTFRYNATRDLIRGVFDWKLDFHWEVLPKQKDPLKTVEPIRSPALAGVLAIDRQFFQKIGAYDPGMVLWGVENIELSIRVWLCGGSMEVIPCSRVGHLEQFHPSFTLPDDDTVEKNKIRVAETWLDAYKNIFYKRNTVAFFIWQSESSNCTERVKLQKMLGCKNFQWYLSNVHQDLYIPQDRQGFSGELYNVGAGYCADHKKGWAPWDGAMDVSPCSGNGNQHCEMNSLKEVRWGPMGQLCFDAKGDRVVLSQCPPKQQTLTRLQWSILKNGQIVHLLTEKCIEAVKTERSPGAEKVAHSDWGKRANGKEAEEGLFLRPCSSDPRQQWHFEQLVDPRRS